MPAPAGCAGAGQVGCATRADARHDANPMRQSASTRGKRARRAWVERRVKFHDEPSSEELGPRRSRRKSLSILEKIARLRLARWVTLNTSRLVTPDGIE